MFKEDLLSFFQGDGIHDALSLHAHQAFLDHFPFGRIDHDGYTGNIRFGGDQV